MQVGLGDGEEQLLGVLDRGLRVLACERKVRDLVRCADESAQERGSLDDRRVRLGVRDRRDVLHEANEELRTADRVEIAAGRELRLHGLEAERLAALPHPLDRSEHEAMLLARKLRRRDASADHLVVDVRVDEHRADQAGLGLRLLRRGLWGTSREIERHTGVWSSGALLKKRACSLAKRRLNVPTGPLRFFATEPWMRRGAPAAVP